MKERIYIIVFVMILATVSGVLIAGINSYTRERILKNKELRLKASILDTFGIDYRKDTLSEVFSKSIETFEKKGRTFYKTKTCKIGFQYSGPGLWGPISGIIVMKEDLETIHGLSIIHQEETPGLGGRISELEFLRRFKDKRVIPRLLILPPGKARGENEVDGITGATMTSKAFEEILNKNIQICRSILRDNR